VTVKLVAAVNPLPSFTVRVIVVVPTFPETGVSVSVREAPAPAKTILVVGANAVLLEAAVTIKDASGVRSSPTVKANGEVAVFIEIL